MGMNTELRPGTSLGAGTHLDCCGRGLEAEADVAHPAEALGLPVEDLLVAQEDSGLLLESLLNLQGQTGREAKGARQARGHAVRASSLVLS